MAETFGTATKFIISELTGEKRTLTLAGRALPYGPITFSGTMGLESTWYPGNPIATTQVFGAREDASTFKGYWKDAFIQEALEQGGTQQFTAIAETEGTQARDVMELAVFVDDIRRKGQLLSIKWDEIVRHGFLQKFTQNWHRRQDLEWEMEFNWISQGDTIPTALLTGQLDLGNIKASWDQLSDLLADAIKNNPLAVLLQILRKIDELSQLISDLVDEITDLIVAVINFVNALRSIGQRLTAIFNNIANAAEQIISVVTSVPPPEIFFFEAVPIFGDELLAEVYTMRIERLAREIQRQALEQLALMLKNLNPDLLGTYIAKDGDNLRDVSVAYFGTPDEWRSLMAFNYFTSSELFAGQIVLIPKSFGDEG